MNTYHLSNHEAVFEVVEGDVVIVHVDFIEPLMQDRHLK